MRFSQALLMMDAKPYERPAGTGRMYLFDGGSSPSLNETLADYVASGFVENIPWTADFSNRTVGSRTARCRALDFAATCDLAVELRCAGPWHSVPAGL